MISTLPVAGGVSSPPPPRIGNVETSTQQFLELLVAQLKNQDPLSPLEGTDFITQLAQFSSLEQLIGVREGLAAQAGAAGLAGLTSESTLAASLLGKSIVARGDQLEVGPDGRARIGLEVGAGGGAARITILDAQGSALATHQVPVGPGRQAIELTASVPPGAYRYSVTVTGPNDGDIAVTPFTAGTVTGFHLEDGGVMLQIGSLTVPLADLTEVQS